MSATAVCALDELEPCTARRVLVDGRPVAVVRIGDEVHAIDDTCSHAEVSLSEGEVWCESREIECWKHGSTFSLVTGRPSTLPATQPVAVWRAWVEGGQVYVEPGEPR